MITIKDLKMSDNIYLNKDEGLKNYHFLIFLSL